MLQSGSSTGDYKLLQRYVTRLSGIGVADEFWLGYQYANASTLNDRTGAAAQSFLTNESNFDDTGVSAGAGVCVTIGRTGLFQRRQCSELYRSACSVAYTAGESGGGEGEGEGCRFHWESFMALHSSIRVAVPSVCNFPCQLCTVCMQLGAAKLPCLVFGSIVSVAACTPLLVISYALA